MSKLGNLGALTGLEIEEEEEEDEVFDQTYEDHTTMEDDRQNSISIRCLFSPIFSFTLVLFDKGPYTRLCLLGCLTKTSGMAILPKLLHVYFLNVKGCEINLPPSCKYTIVQNSQSEFCSISIELMDTS